MRSKRLHCEELEGREMMSAAGLLSSLSGAAGSVTANLSLFGYVFRDRFEPDNTAGQAAAIATNGQAQAHSLHTSTDVDWVKFTLKERSNVVIQTSGRSGDTEMRLFGPDDSTKQITYNNDAGGSKFSRIEQRDDDALEPGTYYVKIDEFGQDATIAAYSISVKATPAPLADKYESDDTWQDAQPITVSGGPQTHNIDVPTDVDWVKFELATTADVVIETRGASGDTEMVLYGESAAVDGPLSEPDLAHPLESDNNDGVGNFSLIVRSGEASALQAGTYWVMVDERGNNAVIPSYTLSVTALALGDVLVTQGKDGLSAVIRVGESLELNVPFADTFSHSAIYVGNGNVAEMLTTGFAITPLAERYAESARVDILRDENIGELGQKVVDAAMQYQGTPYAFAQIGVFARAVLSPARPARVESSLVFSLYKAKDAGPQRMICSELVARAFADALLPIQVTPWPTLAKIKDQGDEFALDFTSPTMLSLSPDFERLNA